MLIALGHQQLTLSATPQPLTPPANVRVDVCIISVETADARYLEDAAPSATVGVRWPAGLAPNIFYGNVNKVQFVAVSGSPVLNIAYYRHG